MKIQIDTEAKTIQISEDVYLEDLMDTLSGILGVEWEKYQLLATTQRPSCRCLANSGHNLIITPGSTGQGFSTFT